MSNTLRMLFSPSWAVVAVLVLGAAACSDSDSPTTPTPPVDPGLQPTFSSIQSLVFDARCVQHHGANGRAGLDLRSPQSHGNLVNMASGQQANLMRVAPGDSEASYLIHKLDGRAGITGSQMPVGGPFLSDAEIAVIANWINMGAPNN